MTKTGIKEIIKCLYTDVVFTINGRGYGICPFRDYCAIGNGKESMIFDTVEEAIQAPVIDGKSVVELWDIIYPQIL